MPIYEYQCVNCEFIKEVFAASYRKKKKSLECDVCTSKCKPIMSRFKTSLTIGKKVPGIDDTDDLTIGKLVMEGGIPAEHKRKINDRKEMVARVRRTEKQLEQRQRKYKFESESGS